MKKLISLFALLFVASVFLLHCGSNPVTSPETASPKLTPDNLQATPAALEKGNGAEKVYILHLTGNGEYILIQVAPNAVPAHLAHGDILVPCAPSYQQGFEASTDGWFDSNSGWYGLATQVSSGTGGIVSSAGSGHAVMEGDASSAPYSIFDGYCDSWTPWTAELDVYLDPSWSTSQGFDYTVAATGSDGAHQRDFIFHVNKDASTGKLLVAGSNNTNFAPREDLENINHYEVTTAGWYTLQHVFYESGGALAVDLNLLDSGGNVLFTETRTNASDVIPDEVGGNRYAWFTFINVDGGVAVDEFEIFRHY
ncbi:MAG: hypothetical protein KDI38_19190 [Calditrichaeota bacterium]|nr:hypothetical protein [Calditrichota bacterium]MCB0305896.1 hypothetical protein [Calditrichota bacterium]